MRRGAARRAAGPPPCAADGGGCGRDGCGEAAGPASPSYSKRYGDFVWVLFGAAEVSFYTDIAVGNSFASRGIIRFSYICL